MQILVFNCGSSSQNYKLYRTQGTHLEVLCKGKAHRVGVKGNEPSFIEHTLGQETFHQTIALPDHTCAARLILQFLAEKQQHFDAIGHRFVHGGQLFTQSIRLTPENYAKLEQILPLAPIHNPNSLSVIKVCREKYPTLPETLTFDTAFHANLPESSYRYALPDVLFQKDHLRKYGFHGLSYQYVSREAARFLDKPLGSLKMIACHLGTGGSSVCAIASGISIDTSMGYSPLAGLMMSTRCGDLDAGIVLDLLRQGKTPKYISDLLNKKSGLLGVSGFSSDIRDLLKAEIQNNDPTAHLAVEMYTTRLRKMIGRYAALLGKFDALLFTDDIGLQNSEIRERSCQGLEWAGVLLDSQANQSAPLDRMTDVSQKKTSVRILVTPTDEESIIASETARLLEVAHA
jgi:acetate kinase